MILSDVETADASTWRDPSAEPPPQGKKILLLTEWGIAVMGHWRTGFIAWAPLPKIPRDIKQRLR